MQRHLLLVALAVGFVCLTSDAYLAAQEKPNPATKPASRNGGWMKRHEAMNKRVAEGNVDIVFIGDSITQGWEGAGRKVWEKCYGKKNAVNLGIGGDQTQHVLWRLQHGNLKGIQPKLAVVMIGTNNASGGHSPEQIAEGIELIVQEIQKQSPMTKILILGVFPRGATEEDRLRQVNAKTNKIITKMADNKKVYYLDIGKDFLKEGGKLTTDIMPDRLHLSPEGYAIWARSIEPMVDQLMGEKK
jgi:beta-glucosidase